MADSIIKSLVDTGAINAENEIDFLVPLHKSGVVNVVQLISETAKNTLNGVLDPTMTTAERVAKAKKLRGYIDVIVKLLQDDEEDEQEQPKEANVVVVGR